MAAIGVDLLICRNNDDNWIVCEMTVSSAKKLEHLSNYKSGEAIGTENSR